MQRKIRAKIKQLGSAVVSRQSLERRREKAECSLYSRRKAPPFISWQQGITPIHEHLDILQTSKMLD
ncbi:MAG: hypothetical protein ABFD53_04600 [Anaerolineaceae bacterium]